MPLERSSRRAIAFFDGQNLFHAARHAFGHTYPNYDPMALGGTLCERQGWTLSEVRFYTGVPDREDDAFWHHFWTSKLASLGRCGVTVYSRALRYRNKLVRLPDGSEHSYLAAEEKGIGVRIAIDVVGLAWQDAFDVALIFSQDQDLSEVAREIRQIACRQDHWIKDRQRFPIQPGRPEGPRHRLDRLDPDRPGRLRRVS